MKRHFMKRLWGPLCWIVLLAVMAPCGYRATGWLLRHDWRPKADAQASQAGRDLFLHEWTPRDPLAGGGDGLGPVFNASSCVACHKQGGVGGSGSLEHNVTIFTRAPKKLGQKGTTASSISLQSTRLLRRRCKTSPRNSPKRAGRHSPISWR